MQMVTVIFMRRKSQGLPKKKKEKHMPIWFGYRSFLKGWLLAALVQNVINV
jgi:hypothetical protein